MYISTMDVENAVLAVFSKFQIPVSGRLAYVTLVKQWPRTHLRHGDLSFAVHRLAKAGDLQLEDTAQGQVVVLTRSGHVRAEQLSRTHIGNLLRRLRFALWPLLRSFERSTAPSAPRRRLADRVAPQL